MRPRLPKKSVNILEIINEIDRRIQVRKELIYITSRTGKCSFREAKNMINKKEKTVNHSFKWECIYREFKMLDDLI